VGREPDAFLSGLVLSVAAPKLTVGLTGGIGSGKSTVGRLFEAQGIAVIDADAIAHALTAPGGAAIPAVREAFGSEFIDSSGALDRARMRQLVFAKPEARGQLEAIIHPLVRAATARAQAEATSPYCILMIPLLVEAACRDPQWRARFSRILVVDCLEATQLDRVMSRSGLAAEEVQRIMAVQATREERLKQADDVIDNNGSSEALAPQVTRLHQRYLQLASA
jgi:dephospho-CoA kinase